MPASEIADLARRKLGIDLMTAVRIVQEARVRSIGELVNQLKHKEVYRS